MSQETVKRNILILKDEASLAQLLENLENIETVIAREKEKQS